MARQDRGPRRRTGLLLALGASGAACVAVLAVVAVVAAHFLLPGGSAGRLVGGPAGPRDLGIMKGKVDWNVSVPTAQAPETGDPSEANVYAMASTTWVGGGVIAPETRGVITGVDQNTGAIRWTLHPPDDPRGQGVFCGGSADSSNGLAIVGVGEWIPTTQGPYAGRKGLQCDRVMLLDLRDGRPRWTVTEDTTTQNLNFNALDMVAAFDSHVVVVDMVGAVRGLSTSTGQTVWQWHGNAPADLMFGGGDLVFLISHAEVGERNGSVVKVDPESGTIRSTVTLSTDAVPPGCPGQLASASPIVVVVHPGCPATPKGKVIYLSGSGSYRVIDGTEPYGNLDLLPINSSAAGDHGALPLVVAGTVLYARSTSLTTEHGKNEVLALDMTTGRKLWSTNPDSIGAIATPFAATKDGVIAIGQGAMTVSNPARAYLLSRKDGSAASLGPGYSDQSLDRLDLFDLDWLFWMGNRLVGVSVNDNNGKGIDVYELS